MGKALFWAAELTGEVLLGLGIDTVLEKTVYPKCDTKFELAVVRGGAMVGTYVYARKWFKELHEVFDALGAFDK